jgi:hypothetical protein
MGTLLHDRVVEARRPSWPWKRLIATHIAAVCVGLLLAAVIYSLVRWDGHAFDSPGGSAEIVPMRVGTVLTIGFDLRNITDEPIVVERIALAGPSRGIHVVGMEAWGPGPAIGAARSWTGKSTQFRGYVIPPHSKFSGVNVGFRIERAGSYLVKGVRVWYRTGLDLPLLGRGHYVQTTGPYAAVCASSTGKCRPPQPL